MVHNYISKSIQWHSEYQIRFSKVLIICDSQYILNTVYTIHHILFAHKNK